MIKNYSLSIIRVTMYNKILVLRNHQVMCQSSKRVLCPNQVPKFNTPCLRCVGYTISMCGLKTNGACVGSGSLSSTFKLMVPLGLSNCTLRRGIMITHMSPFFSFLKKKKYIYIYIYIGPWDNLRENCIRLKS